jgi:hypothetical protein
MQVGEKLLNRKGRKMREENPQDRSGGEHLSLTISV